MSSSSRHAVIIGGGVIGTACAYFLMRTGWKVTIEADHFELGARRGDGLRTVRYANLV